MRRINNKEKGFLIEFLYKVNLWKYFYDIIKLIIRYLKLIKKVFRYFKWNSYLMIEDYALYILNKPHCILLDIFSSIVRDLNSWYSIQVLIMTCSLVLSSHSANQKHLHNRTNISPHLSLHATAIVASKQFI